MLTNKELTDEPNFLGDIPSDRKRRVANWVLDSGWLVIIQGPDAPRIPLGTSSSRGLRWHGSARPLDFSRYCFA